MIYKYCRRCGKRLKGEENRARGYGKICFEKARAEARRRALVPPKTPPREKQLEDAEQGKGEVRGQSKGKAAEQGQRAKRQRLVQGKGQAKQEAKGKAKARQTKRAKTPHLEKTLTPTYKKPLLFTPPTLPPPPDEG